MPNNYDTLRRNYENTHHLAILTYSAEDSTLLGGENRNWTNGLSSGNTIKAYLPENFQMSFSSSFDQPFAQGFIQNDMVKNVANLAGYSVTSQAMTVHIWQGSSPVEFSLTMVFLAEDDPIEDVVKKVATLVKLERPGMTKTGGLLLPPGPRIDIKKVPAIFQKLGETAGAVLDDTVDVGTNLLKKAAGASGPVAFDFTNTTKKIGELGDALAAPVNNPTNNISLQIGNMFLFKSVFVESVSSTYDTVMDQNGRPIKTQVDVTFKTFTTPTKADIDTMFMLD